MRLPDFDAMYADMSKPLGNRCRCEKCGYQVTVDPAKCLRSGWPMCCGFTMTTLSKDECSHV